MIHIPPATPVLYAAYRDCFCVAVTTDLEATIPDLCPGHRTPLMWPAEVFKTPDSKFIEGHACYHQVCP